MGQRNTDLSVVVVVVVVYSHTVLLKTVWR